MRAADDDKNAATPLAPLAALVAGAMAMGISPIFVRIADVGPFASAFWRVALALPLLLVWLRLSAEGAKNDKRFSRAAILAGLAFTGDLFFWHLSIVSTSVADATFFATTAPIWVVLIGWAALGRRPGRGMVLGLLLCMAGGAALLARSLQFHPAGALGDLYGLVTGFFFGVYFLFVEAARRFASAARVTFEATVVTAAGLFVVAMSLEGRILPHSLGGVAALFAMAWVSHVGGQGLLAVALGRLPASFSSLVIFLEAVAAACFAALFLGEPVSAVQALGGALILGGIFVARPRQVGERGGGR